MALRHPHFSSQDCFSVKTGQRCALDLLLNAEVILKWLKICIYEVHKPKWLSDNSLIVENA